MLTSTISIIFTILLIETKRDVVALLDIEHPYEVIDYDKSILTELKLHRQRRSIRTEEFEDEINRRWKRSLDKELKKENFDDYDQHLAKHNALHMYSRLPENEFDLKNHQNLELSDDELFKQNKLRNQIKQDTLNEKFDGQHFKLNFNAHKREFKLLLKSKHQNNVFAPDVEFESTNGRFNYDKDNIINGYLEGKIFFLFKND